MQDINRIGQPGGVDHAEGSRAKKEQKRDGFILPQPQPKMSKGRTIAGKGDEINSEYIPHRKLGTEPNNLT
jgi:hypothetical protein